MVANRVREWRVRQGLSQSALAAMVGVSRQTIWAIEAGDYNPTVRLALSLADSLRASIGELFWLTAREDDSQCGQRGS